MVFFQMQTELVIKVSGSSLRASINCHTILSAPTAKELVGLIGVPSRVVNCGPEESAAGNNQVHVYDELGVYFNQHHHTRRIMGMTIVFWHEGEGYRFTPETSFRGSLHLEEYKVTSNPSLLEFLESCPIRLEHFLGGHYQREVDGYSFGITSGVAKTRSHRRAERALLIGAHIGWPHDPWGTPAH